MALTNPVLLLAGLVEMVLPSRTVRICDGGFVNWPGVGLFTSQDSAFGTIESVESISEGLGDDAPGGRLTLLPVSTADASALFQSNAQGSLIRFWLAEVDRQTGLMVGTPDLKFIGMLDSIKLSLGMRERKVEVEFVATAERLFLVREGNVLSPRFHQMAWPGENGFNNATGNSTQVPWGVTGPPRGSSYYYGGYGGGGGGGGGLGLNAY